MTQHAPLRIEGESIQADGCCPMCEKSFEKIENKVAILCCCTVICEACFRAFMKKSIDAEGFPPCPLCNKPFADTDEKARAALERHVEADQPFALELLGGMYHQGTMGLGQDLRRAARLYRRAAKLGRARAAVRVGLMHLEGEGVRKDVTIAARYFERAASARDPFGLYFAGLAHSEGTPVRDVPRAIEFWAGAADLGHGPSAAAIGVVYDRGDQGVEANVAKAATWYARAGILGDHAAQERLVELRAYVATWKMSFL